MALSASILFGGGTVLVGTAIELATVRQAALGPAPQLVLAPMRTMTGTAPALVLHTRF